MSQVLLKAKRYCVNINSNIEYDFITKKTKSSSFGFLNIWTMSFQLERHALSDFCTYSCRPNTAAVPRNLSWWGPKFKTLCFP